MSVRKKALLILAVTFTGLMLTLYLSYRAIVEESFASLETHEAEVNAERALAAIERDIEELGAAVANAVRFSNITNYHPATRTPDLERELFATMLMDQLHLIIVVDSNANVVLDQAIDPVSGRPTPIPAGIAEHLSTGGVLLRHEEGLQGVMIIPEGPLLVAAYPIPATRGGPVGGTLIMGRFLDRAKIDSLSELTQLSLTVHKIGDPEIPPDVRMALLSLSQEHPVEVVPLWFGHYRGIHPHAGPQWRTRSGLKD